jgi:DNA-binding NtrC family response regulator
MVILDMIMPGMSGGEAFDRLREIDPQVLVLLSSGYSIDGGPGRFSTGLQRLSSKPFRWRRWPGACDPSWMGGRKGVTGQSASRPAAAASSEERCRAGAKQRQEAGEEFSMDAEGNCR